MTRSHTGEEEAAMNRQLDVEEGSQRTAGDDAENQPLSEELATFERERLALFSRYGFEGESRWVTDQEGRSTYMIGRGQGPCPTVLVHGGLSEASEWALLAGRLPGHVIIPDRPGCGLSYPIDYRGVDYRTAAASWVLDMVDGIGAAQVDLVGNSMGGFFAIAFALAHPDRVRRLVLPGASAGLDKHIPLFLRLWGNQVIGPLMTWLGITIPPSAEALRKRVFTTLLVAHPERVPLDMLEVMIAAAALPGVGLAAHTMLRTVTDLRGWRPRLMMRDDMAHLPVPTLFVWGDADAFAPPSSGRDMAARMPDAHIEVIADAGHLPYLDRPEAVADAIKNFLVHSETS
ncbi:MAG TPA: alpha/beta hydrolase [Rubrobacteraceae bacterium]|nr:alpha/beta hydrolase [Rubrobacteraceae bacterium]